MEPTVPERLNAALAALKRCEEHSLAGQFALEVMHEIRNPLDALGNLVHLAGLEEDLTIARQHLRDAEEQITMLHQIAGQSLTIARVSQAPVSVSLLELAEAAIRIHHRRVKAKRVTLVRDLDQTGMVTVKPGEIVQVLSNLVGNSLDALSDEGTIALRIRKRSDHLCVIVADNGHGISQDHLGRLFEPFFSTKHDVGNGLGLTLSKKIIDRHGGSIRVRSCTGPRRYGTTFRVCIPLANAA